MTMRSIFFALLCAAACTQSMAQQSKEELKYRETSEEIRKQVWAWEKPQFKVHDIPPAYAKSSKVIIAQHIELTAQTRSKFAFYVLTYSIKKEQNVMEVVRELVKLNDKKAVDEYSSLSFTQFEKRSSFYRKDKNESYIGVRVIKPGGAIKEINADDIVLTKDEKDKKQAKLAIPDLQPGDMLDYFVATEQIMTNDFTERHYTISLYDAAPVLSCSFHAQLSKKYMAEYRSYNGAPEPKVSKNEDDEMIIDVADINMPATENSLWVVEKKQLPFVRINIALCYKKDLNGLAQEMIPGSIIQHTSMQRAFDEKANILSNSYYSGCWLKSYRREHLRTEEAARKRAKRINVDYDKMSEEDRIAFLYYNFRFDKVLAFYPYQLAKYFYLNQYLYDKTTELFNLYFATEYNPAYVLGSSNSWVRMDEAMHEKDLAVYTYLPSINKFIAMESVYEAPFLTPKEIEGATGTKSFTFKNPKTIISAYQRCNLHVVTDGPNIPVTNAWDNAKIDHLQLSISADNNTLDVKRSTRVTGHFKKSLQQQFILYEDFYEQERKAFNEEMSLMDVIKSFKSEKKLVEEMTVAFAEARKRQKDVFFNEAKDWLQQEISNLANYHIDSLGVRHTQPAFIFSSSFTLGGLLKKAGNNIVVEIGKIQGDPLKIEEGERRRNLDVYMPFARTIAYNVELDIPEGYTAEGVATLNRDVSNETGVFKVTASNTDKVVTIQVTKQYLHNFEPAANWNKMLEFLDASVDWMNAKLLLKKK